MKKVLHESRRRGIDWEQWSSSDMVKNSWTWCVLDDPSTLVVHETWMGAGLIVRWAWCQDENPLREMTPSQYRQLRDRIRGCVNGVVTFKFRAYGHNPFYENRILSLSHKKFKIWRACPQIIGKGPKLFSPKELIVKNLPKHAHRSSSFSACAVLLCHKKQRTTTEDNKQYSQ